MSSWIRPEKRRHFRGKRGPNRPSAKLTAHASRTWRKAAAEGRWHQRGFRSVRESRLLRSLVWQWFCSESQSRCSMRKLARRLGCDKSWIIQLRRKFRANPEQQRKREELHGPATWAEFDEERNKRLSDLRRFMLYRQPRIRRRPQSHEVFWDGEGRVLYDPTEIERQLKVSMRRIRRRIGGSKQKEFSSNGDMSSANG
jgi:transcriptional regulator with XRE-family HTH domain